MQGCLRERKPCIEEKIKHMNKRSRCFFLIIRVETMTAKKKKKKASHIGAGTSELLGINTPSGAKAQTPNFPDPASAAFPPRALSI